MYLQKLIKAKGKNYLCDTGTLEGLSVSYCLYSGFEEGLGSRKLTLSPQVASERRHVVFLGKC